MRGASQRPCRSRVVGLTACTRTFASAGTNRNVIPAIAEALDVRAAAWPNGHPGSVATYLLRAKHGWRYGQMTASGDDHRRSVELAEAALRPGHPVRTLVEARLAAWEATEGELELALPRHVAALAAAKPW